MKPTLLWYAAIVQRDKVPIPVPGGLLALYVLAESPQDAQQQAGHILQADGILKRLPMCTGRETIGPAYACPRFDGWADLTLAWDPVEGPVPSGVPYKPR